MHEQSETIQRADGKWVNVYGKALPKAGQQLPGTPTFNTVDDAVTAAKARSKSFDHAHAEIDPNSVQWDAAPSIDPGQVQWDAPAKASLMDKVVGSAAGRTVLGMASPLIGAAQAGAHVGDAINRMTGTEPVVSPWIDKQLKELEASKKRGMESYGHDKDSVDWMGMIGSFIPGAAMAKGVAKALPGATGPAGRAGVAAVQGATVGASQPSTGEDFASEKMTQGGLGALLGGAGSLATDVVKGGAHLVGKLKPFFTKEGYKTVADDVVKKVVGPDNVEKLGKAALAAQPKLPGVPPPPGASGPTLPGSPMTAAEATAGIPEASPLAALQQAIFKRPGGPSKIGGELARDAQVAQKAGWAQLDAATGPARERILDAANATGQLKIDPIVKGIGALKADPEVAGTINASKVLSSIEKALNKRANPDGSIDAKTLYAFKKEGVNEVIDAVFGKVDPKGSQAFKAGQLIEVKKLIDDAIEQAGGTGWRSDYLKPYSEGARNIVADTMAKKTMYKPLQRTALGAPNYGAEADLPLGGGPMLLNRAYSLAKWIPKARAEAIEGRVEGRLAELLADSQKFGQQYANPPIPNRYAQIIDALMKQQAVAGGIAAGHAGRN